MQRDDFRGDLPVSRGQWRAIALDALRVLGIEAPASRYDATVTIVRLRESETGPVATDVPADHGF